MRVVQIDKNLTLKVLIATPFGRGGRGGIDRIMDNLEAASKRSNEFLQIDILQTRGDGHSVMMVLHMIRFFVSLFIRKLTNRIDLVHINVAQRGSVTRKAMLASACHRLGVPYVLHVHGSQFHHYWQNGGPAAQRRLRNLIDQAARVVVLGTFWRDFLISVGAEPLRVVIVPNATAHPARANVHDPQRPASVLFLGKMSNRKGTPQLIEALSRLTDLGPWRATLAGNGDVEQARKRVAELGLTDRVNVLGWAGPEDVERLLSDHDILTLPSFDENLPMSVIEGMAHGMAVVTTPVGAVRDIITDGQSGLLVEPGDIAGLSVAIGRCITDATLRARLGASARAYHGDHLDLDIYPHRIAEVWRDAAARSIGV